MDYAVEPTILNTDGLPATTTANGLWENRAVAYAEYDAPGVPRCTIVVQGYNRLEKTRYCVECVLKYTQNVDYELILVDNGSDDGTYAYFQSVPYANKRVIKVTKNISASFPFQHVAQTFKGKYLVYVPNDVYVTRDWLANILACYESDPRVGFVMPVSSSASNFQQVDLPYSNFEEMQEQAALFNKSDPAKWEERMRLQSVISVFSRPILDLVGIIDRAFVHDFGEDDWAIRLRRAGYKLILLRDTWICHDHNLSTDKDPVAYAASLDSGRAIYKEKHYGIDAWDDMNNIERMLLAPLDSVDLPEGEVSSLVVDGRCGAPAQEIRNHLRKRGITAVHSRAFTTQAKYYLDLQTVTQEVRCDRIDYIQAYYANRSLDVVALCEPVNTYPTPFALLQKLYDFLRPGGVLLFKLRSTNDFITLLRCAGLTGGKSDADLPIVLPLGEVRACIKLLGGRELPIRAECHAVKDEDRDTVMGLLKAVNPLASENDLMHSLTNNYVFCVLKDAFPEEEGR